MAISIAHSTDENQLKLSISYTKSQKGKHLLLANEYVFKLNKTTPTTKYWKYTFNDCSSKLHTNLDDKLLETIDDLSHLPEKENIEVLEFRKRVKQRAINDTTPIPRIYNED